MRNKKLLLLLMFCAACRGKQGPAGFQRPPAPVSVETAVSRDVPVYADEVGKCVAREVVSIVPQVSGRITEIHFADGANVRSGDLLFTIDPRPYQAQLDAAEANLAQAHAARELARTELARSAELLKAQLVSQSDYDTKKSTAQVDEAQVQQAEASVKAARLNLQYCSIHSPIDGRAGHRLVDLGNVVAANGASLLTIERLDPIYADFTVTENDLSRVQQHMAHGELKVEVRLPDEPGKPLTGTLTFLDNTVQESTGTVTLRATVPNREHRLWPGRFVKVRLVLATIKGAVLVPTTAVQVSAKGPFVYVVGDDSTAELRPVVPGQSQDALVVIEKGLKAGERVVVNGQLAVTPGGKVAVAESAS